MRRTWVAILAPLVLIGGLFFLWRTVRAHRHEPAFRTVAVQRGDVKVQVSATGNLKAVTTVQVGSQVTGTISALNADFNDHVRKGQVLAQLDPTFLKAQVAQSLADLNRAQVQVRQAERDSARIFPLGANGLASKSELDATQTALDAARAGAASAQAGLERAQTNLRYATIESPIDGVVISRNVDVGQTVAASLSAPTLFSIANDLTQMQLEAAVDEADIGQIRTGQHATFTVDAFPDQTFRGEVQQIRLSPETVQNVVTYTVIIYLQNPDQILLPGMTANVSILIDSANDVLKVPALALRFRPPGAMGPRSMSGPGNSGNGGNGGNRAGGPERPAETRRPQEMTGGTPGPRPDQGPRGGMGAGDGQRMGPGARFASAGAGSGGPPEGGIGHGAGRGPDSDPKPGAAKASFGTLYLLDGLKKLRQIPVRVGLSDGTFTSVSSDSLSEGAMVVVGTENPGDRGQQSQGTVNPFQPRFGGGRR